MVDFIPFPQPVIARASGQIARRSFPFHIHNAPGALRFPFPFPQTWDEMGMQRTRPDVPMLPVGMASPAHQ